MSFTISTAFARVITPSLAAPLPRSSVAAMPLAIDLSDDPVLFCFHSHFPATASHTRYAATHVSEPLRRNTVAMHKTGGHHHKETHKAMKCSYFYCEIIGMPSESHVNRAA